MKSWQKFLITAVVVAVAVVAAAQLGILSRAQELLVQALDWINGLGPLAPIAFIVVYIVATVLFIPGTLLTLGAGFVFGLFKGFIFVSLGSTLGAGAAFLVGRHVARERIATTIEANPKFKAIDDAVSKEGWKIVALTRLSPVLGFTVLNYAFSLTKVNFFHYLVASWICMMPGTVLYVYFGTLAESLATLNVAAEQASADSLASKALLVVGLAVTFVVTVYVTRIAQKALNSQLEGASGNEDAESQA